MTVTTAFPQAPDVSADDYCAIGVATCFVREAGEVQAVEIVEPIPSAQLATLFQGIPTSYSQVWGKQLKDFWAGESLQQPADLPANAQLCADFAERAIAAARTYQRHPDLRELLPLGTHRDDLNYSTEKKRVLNSDRVVRSEDNVKQHSYTHQVF